MIYRKFQDIELSGLGFGAMRMPVVNGVYGNVDETAVAEMVEHARQQGINYFDTAWGYHDGNSEIALGNVLSRYPRETFYLADKFPGYDPSNWGKIEEIFEEQLRKCKTEYFDFYLFHNVCEMNIDAYLNQEFGIFDYLMKQKEAGRIRHLGFSAHGSIEVMERFLQAYGKSMEFGQIQLNYLDYTFQNAKSKIELLESYQIPVWVMEPLRGGTLCRLSEQHEKELKELRPKEGIPAWAFRFLQSIPSVTMVLSGMSEFGQLQENLDTFTKDLPLNETERQTLEKIAGEMLSLKTVPCTGCRYCTSHCPKELDIPNLLSLYNEFSFTGGGFIAPMVLMSLPQEKRPQSCIGCRSCETVCPQQIKISETLAEFAQKTSA